MMLRFLFVALVLFAGVPAGSGNQVIDISPTLVLPSMSGRDIFRYYCATCHGREGRGDGPVGAQLKTRPANLTRLAASNGGQFPLERVQGLRHPRPYKHAVAWIARHADMGPDFSGPLSIPPTRLPA